MLRKALLLLLVLVLIPCISHAEIKAYTHTVRQSFSGSQSPDEARIGAIWMETNEGRKEEYVRT